MAGSFRHVTNSKGELREPESDGLDNLGDAREAIEEMYEMIHHLTGGDKQKMYEAWRDGYAKKHIPPENMDLPEVASAKAFWDEDEEDDEDDEDE